MSVDISSCGVHLKCDIERHVLQEMLCCCPLALFGPEAIILLTNLRGWLSWCFCPMCSSLWESHRPCCHSSTKENQINTAFQYPCEKEVCLFVLNVQLVLCNTVNLQVLLLSTHIMFTRNLLSRFKKNSTNLKHLLKY